MWISSHSHAAHDRIAIDQRMAKKLDLHGWIHCLSTSTLDAVIKLLTLHQNGFQGEYNGKTDRDRIIRSKRDDIWHTVIKGT
jgi:hypothetical protein